MSAMAEHPYKNFPETSFWQEAVAKRPVEDIDPILAAPFKIMPEDKIMTAGSCFAQHIGRALKGAGFCHFVTEALHPILSRKPVADRLGETQYGIYTARYGNIYTARQLLQLLRRAYGRFDPGDDVWPLEDGRFADPFRPRIQEGGFLTREELLFSRAHHLRCVRRGFEEASYFIFTLGLTECWEAKADGAVFPLCPGVAGGAFDSDRYVFRNFTVAEVVADMKTFLEEFGAINPSAKIILTVSPVPLAATAEPRHVLVSTVASKAILRAACDEIERACHKTLYFPAYEIVTNSYKGSGNFSSDGRSVTAAGVKRVMDVFMRHLTSADFPAGTRPASLGRDEETIEEGLSAVCEEELLSVARRK